MQRLHLPDQIAAVSSVPMPSGARPAGYAALIAAFGLSVPPPDQVIAIGEKHTFRQEGSWRILTPRYRPEETVQAHVEFALKHEGVDLGVLNALFKTTPPQFVEEWVRTEPTGQSARRTWFLYEWLTGKRLNLPDVDKMPYTNALDEKRQFALKRGERVRRYRIRNNLPGTPDFCPLVRRSVTLEACVAQDLASEARSVVSKTAPDLLARAAAFLLLEDSKASYVIEGERPPQDRITRWGQAIGEAGKRQLTVDEFLRLQRTVIADERFTPMGWRTEGGFIGMHDRDTRTPLPEHISARPEDLPALIRGLIAYAERSEREDLDPIIEAAAVAFGFVFIHPFVDGNGRIHRWLVHHILGHRGFSPPGIIFPVSAVFLERVKEYQEILKHYSRPRLELTSWEITPSWNVRVLNDTRHLFQFFDATRQAEFLVESVVQTIRALLPKELEYLRRYDQAKRQIESFLDLPDTTFDLMMSFLRQNAGRFSNRARTNEFARLTDEEAASIEGIYHDLLLELDQPASGGAFGAGTEGPVPSAGGVPAIGIPAGLDTHRIRAARGKSPQKRNPPDYA